MTHSWFPQTGSQGFLLAKPPAPSLRHYHIFHSLNISQKWTLEGSHHKMCHEDSSRLKTLQLITKVTEEAIYGEFILCQAVYTGTQIQNDNTQGDDEIYITHKRTQIQRSYQPTYQGHKLDSDWARTHTHTAKLGSSWFFFPNTWVVSGHCHLERKI